MSLLPAPSVNLYVTVVLPIGNDEPGGWDLLLIGGTPELSIAVGSSHVAVAKLDVAGAVTWTGTTGQLKMTGGMVSIIPPAGRYK